MHHAPQGVHDFLRAYYHHKSADWKANKPYPLKGWTATELAKLPTYYVMDLAKNMAETVAEGNAIGGRDRFQSMAARARTRFLQHRIQRTGFQGGLQWYRCNTSGAFTAELEDLVGQDHRRALLLHLGPAGLGHLPAPRRVRGACRRGPAPT